jgi:two-component system KDP operon response regulator KdpE
MSEPKPRILVVDDEPPIRRLLRTSLTSQGFTVLEASTGEQAIQATAMERPDVMVLDLALPDVDGVEVTRRVREWSKVPIIVLSARGMEQDKIAALDAGADDYLTKPFGMGELLARIRVALRHLGPPSGDAVYAAGDLTVDLARRLVTIGGQDLSLTPIEYDVLKVLVSHAGKVLTHKQLLKEVWGPAYEQEVHLLRVNISNLRRKLEPDPARPQYIVTEPGVGYRMRAAS